MSLQDEINVRSSTIFRDSYQMSIGELINIYRDGEMDIHPEFQRVFRWENYQKTKLIESILLNIPIPPIFVSQNEDGIWDVIDGVQRLSTIFQFVGILKDDCGKSVPPLKLLKTDYLPSLKDMYWSGEDQNKSFTKEQQLFFKRARIDIIIMKKESDPNTKYELFQRLNTGGSLLSEQEVRNCLIIMSNKKFYELLIELDSEDCYKNCLPLSDRKTDEQYRLELLLRLLIASFINWENTSYYEDLSELLNKETVLLCETNLDYDAIKHKFKNTFQLLNSVMGEEAFKKFNGTKHVGAVLSSAFQAIAVGVYSHIDLICEKEGRDNWLKEKIRSLYKEECFEKNSAPGTRAIPKFRDLSRFSINYFSP